MSPRRLVDWSRRNRVEATSHRVSSRPCHSLVRLATPLSRPHAGHARVFRRGGTVQNRHAHFQYARVRSCLCRDLGADSGGITDRQADTRSKHSRRLVRAGATTAATPGTPTTSSGSAAAALVGAAGKLLTGGIG